MEWNVVNHPFGTDESGMDELVALGDDILGSDAVIETPFGFRTLLYFDFTASGRSLGCIEDFMRFQVMPLYANTHSETSMTAVHVNSLRHQAREVIRDWLGAEEDSLIFTGSGSTGAIWKFLAIMSQNKWSLAPPPTHSGDQMADPSLPLKPLVRRVIFIVDSSSHHSVILPFRELAQHSELIVHAPTHAASEAAAGGNPLPPFLAAAPCPSEYHPSEDFRQSVQLYFHVIEVPSDKTSGVMSTPAYLEALRHCWRLQEERRDEEVVPLSFLTAVSNVTGMEHNVPLMVSLAHSFGSPILVDFAAAAAHTRPDANPDSSTLPQIVKGGKPLVSLEEAENLPKSCFMRWMVETRGKCAGFDVAVFSPHKLLGGPGTPGLLLIKNYLASHSKPGQPGGGCVAFVSKDGHSYLKNVEEREEAGTPDILGSIRAGLMFRLHASIGIERIRAREQALANFLISAWAQHPNIDLVGPSTRRLHFCRPPGRLGVRTPGVMESASASASETADVECLQLSEDTESPWDPGRVGIISFRVRARRPSSQSPNAQWLHHQFVCALLNDIFGVQIRSGCACAGPYLIQLMGISDEEAEGIRKLIEATDCHVMKPGVSRAGVHFTMSDEEAVILRDAVLWVASFAEELLQQYTFVPTTGRWVHQTSARHLPPTELFGKDLRYAPREITSEEDLSGVLEPPAEGAHGEERQVIRYAHSVEDLKFSATMEGIDLHLLDFETLRENQQRIQTVNCQWHQQLVFGASRCAIGGGSRSQASSQRRTYERRALAATPKDVNSLFSAANQILQKCRQGLSERDRSRLVPLPCISPDCLQRLWFKVPDPHEPSQPAPSHRVPVREEHGTCVVAAAEALRREAAEATKQIRGTKGQGRKYQESCGAARSEKESATLGGFRLPFLLPSSEEREREEGSERSRSGRVVEFDSPEHRSEQMDRGRGRGWSFFGNLFARCVNAPGPARRTGQVESPN